MLERGIGAARTHGDADISGRDAGGIVHAIPDHGDAHFATLLKILDGLDFFVWREFGEDLPDANHCTDQLGGIAVISCQHDGADSLPVERPEGEGRFRPHLVGEDHSSQEIVACNPDNGSRCFSCWWQLPARKAVESQNEFPAPHDIGHPVDVGPYSLAQDGLEVGRFHGGSAPGCGNPPDGAGEGML